MSGPWDKHIPAGAAGTKDDEPLTVTLLGDAARLVREHARHHNLTNDETVVVAVACACFDYGAFTHALRVMRMIKVGFGR